MHNRQALSFIMFWECLTDWHMWPIYLIGLTWLIPNFPMGAYLTLQLRAIGFDTFQTNLLTIPAYVLFILQLLFWTWLSEKINQRFLLGVATQLWALPLLIALELIPSNTGARAKYALSVLLVGAPYVHAILVAITSRNAGTVRTRTVASALYNMFVQASSIIASNIYRDDDKPMYRRGNKVLLGICAYNTVLFVGAKLFYVYINKRRDKIWNSVCAEINPFQWTGQLTDIKMTQEQREEYLATTTDKGNKRLDFRFAH